MDFFTTSFDHTYQTELVIPPSNRAARDMYVLGARTAVKMLQDYPEHIRLNPLVTNINQLHPNSPNAVDVTKVDEEFEPIPPKEVTSDWTHYEVFDELPLGFGYTKQLVYYLALRNIQDGIDGYTDAGSGVRIRGVWRVGPSPDWKPNTLLLREHATVKCPVWVAWYIKATLGKSHEALQERFKKIWEERIVQQIT